ncbi:MAG: [FeFe] hydrogenase, group A [Lachnospiraceae bacterium]|nr:[FeFe] hydrogenase, group A [Candidatus Minthocola equi]
MEYVNLKINGQQVKAPKGSTVLEAARLANIKIPTLCFLKEINEIGACRVCIVELANGKIVTSCVYPAEEGMEVYTNTPRVLEYRKKTVQLLLSNHNRSCLSCVRSGKCELQTLAHELGIEDEGFYDGVKTPSEIDTSAPHLVRDNSKCILCRRCVAACEATQSVSVIGANNRGFDTCIGSAFEMGLAETACINCGQCIAVCPTGALTEKDDTPAVFAALADKSKYVVVQTAPAVRAALGEEFGYPMGTDVEGQMAAALRRLGFNAVFDTDFAADLTIVEEAHELMERVEKGGKLPLITSCSPGWVRFCETYFPQFIPNLSSCKSPQTMQGAIIKSYYAKKMKIKPQDITVVSVMPCTAKKFEVTRPDECGTGYPDVDIVITTRELARMIKKAGIDFANLPKEDFDDPLGESTGAGVIFGATGGVMEAALRTAVCWITGKTPKAIEFKEVRGTQGIKEASYKVGKLEIKVAVASGLANARKLLEMVASGEKQYTFIEIMACPGGCVNGGGQPQVCGEIRNTVDIAKVRGKALYKNDAAKKLRLSHKNPEVIKLYDEFLGEPGSKKAHKLLHTTYVKREINSAK